MKLVRPREEERFNNLHMCVYMRKGDVKYTCVTLVLLVLQHICIYISIFDVVAKACNMSPRIHWHLPLSSASVYLPR